MTDVLCNRILLVMGSGAKPDTSWSTAWKHAAKVIGGEDWQAWVTHEFASAEQGTLTYLTAITVVADSVPDGQAPAPYTGSVQDVAVGVRVDARALSLQEAYDRARAHAVGHMEGVSHYDERVDILAGDGEAFVCVLDALSPNQHGTRWQLLRSRAIVTTSKA